MVNTIDHHERNTTTSSTLTNEPRAPGGTSTSSSIEAPRRQSSPRSKQNFFQGEIAEAAFRYQSEIEAEQRVIVGVNRYEVEGGRPVEILRIDPALEREQIDAFRRSAPGATPPPSRRVLRQLEDARHKERNLMEPIMAASVAYATMGEMCDVLRGVWGVWRETPVF